MKIDYQKRIFGLDIMRAVAILCVVIAHALWNFPEREGPVVGIMKLMGVMGVEIFFVLSGFLIGRILYRIYTNPNFQLSDFKYFLVRRWFRTLPNYYLILLVNIVIVWHIGSRLPETIGSYFFFLQNAVSEMPIFFTESWSLPIEEFTYILCPLLLYLAILLFRKRDRRKLFLWVTLILIFFFIGTKVFYHFNDPVLTMTRWNRDLKAVLIYRLDAICYGILAAYLSMIRPEFWKRRKGMLFRLGSVLFISAQLAVPFFGWIIEDAPFYWNVLYLPICSVSVALTLPWLSHCTRAPRKVVQWVTFISVISYAMYLLHYSVILNLMRFHLPIEDLSFPEKIAYSVLYFVLTIVCSYFLYSFFEKPVMDIRDRKYFRKKFSQP